MSATRADGTAVAAFGPATGGTLTAARTVNLTTAHTALLDKLTVTWVSPTKGTLVSYVEVVGGFLFTLAEARAKNPLADTVKYPTARLIEARTLVESAIEEACDVAFVPRYYRERISRFYGWSETNLRLRWQKVRTLREATVNGTVLDATALATVVPYGGYFYYPGAWNTANVHSDITVGYEHGMDSPPPRITQAALLLLRRWLVEGPADDRATSMLTEDGTFSLVTPGLRGMLFDIPEVNAAHQQHRMPSVV